MTGGEKSDVRRSLARCLRDAGTELVGGPVIEVCRVHRSRTTRCHLTGRSSSPGRIPAREVEEASRAGITPSGQEIGLHPLLADRRDGREAGRVVVLDEYLVVEPPQHAPIVVDARHL